MSSQDDLVRSLLRPSENLQCFLDVESTETTKKRSERKDTSFPRHSIAVVTHRSYSHDTEVGSLLVFKSDPPTTNGLLRAADALPITEYFSFAVAQTGPIDSPTGRSDPGAPTEPWSAWLLSLRRDAQDTRPLAFAVRTRHTQRLQHFTAECRRLKEIATTAHPVGTDFAWVEAYLSDPPSSYRPDIRLRKQPLHTHLSPAFAGLPGDDVSDISIVRRDWIEQAAGKEVSGGNMKHLKIRLGTFNVNDKAPSQDLYPWLRSSQHEGQGNNGWISPLKLSPFEVCSDPLHKEPHDTKVSALNNSDAFGDPDMLVLGFQELDLSTEALLYTASTLKEDVWLTAIFAGLGEKRVLYEKLISRQLVGMLLIVIVKKPLVPCFTDVRSCDAGAGIMGFMGNKGATAIRLEFTPRTSSDPKTTKFRSIVLTFVNAHLAASDEMAERRHYDFQELSNRLAFTPNGLNARYLPTSLASDTYSMYQSDVLFWMVYLNYRLDLSDGDIRKLLSSHVSGIDSIQTLLSYDQLRAAIRSDVAFSAFTEPAITHIPTYRLAQSVAKDQLGYDVKRKPAWTDRILFMAPPELKVTPVAYRSHPEITMSDHQPVSADFDISLPLIDRSQYESVASALHRELAVPEASEHRPKIKIQPISIDFGSVKYKQAVDREIVMRNEGDTPCVFRFVGAGSDSEPVSPSWLRIEPMVGFLRPHGTVTVSLSVYINDNSAASLNLGPSLLECTLILHTALGKDDFVVVSGNFQYTCFANTLERLTRLARPIGKLESPDEMVPPGQATDAPPEMMRLVHWMMTYVSATDALFECPAQERVCHVIRECLDTGDEFPCEGPEVDHRTLVAAFSSTLVAFLESLIEPVVPAHLHAQCLQAREKDEAFEALSAFPHENINVWISLTACLHYVAQQGVSKDDVDATGSNRAHRLASVFAPVLLRDDPTGVWPRASPVGKRDFLLHFID